MGSGIGNRTSESAVSAGEDLYPAQPRLRLQVKRSISGADGMRIRTGLALACLLIVCCVCGWCLPDASKPVVSSGRQQRKGYLVFTKAVHTRPVTSYSQSGPMYPIHWASVKGSERTSPGWAVDARIEVDKVSNFRIVSTPVEYNVDGGNLLLG